MSVQRYRYAIELYSNDGECFGQAPMSVDFDPALEWAWLQGIRRGELQLTDGTSASAIDPLWHQEVGEPYIEGFRVTVFSDEGDGTVEDFPIDYFKRAARTVRASLVEAGRLQTDESVRYLTTAYFNEQHATAGPSPPFRSREVPPHLTLKESALSGLISASAVMGETHPDDLPIVIPRIVLEETRELSRRAGPKETGGILIGHLHRDPRLPEVFAEITAQIPATHTLAKVDRLTFTSDTWTAARAAVDLRRKEETFLGWWHSHPAEAWQCKNCPKEKKAACPLARGFLSAEDRQLHRTIFSRAFTCALIASEVGENNVIHSLFGWRRGLLESRGYYVVDDARGSVRIDAMEKDR